MTGNDDAKDARATLVSSDVRRHNLSIVMGALASAGSLSRIEIAQRTGLTPGAVTLLASTLVEAGLVAEASMSSPGRRGRPRTSLSIAAKDVGLAVLQLDADTATGVLSTLAGDEIGRVVRHHGRPMGNPDHVLDVAAGVLDEVLRMASTAGRAIADLTVVAFAPVGGDPAVVIADSDLRWGTVDVLGELRRRLPAMPSARLVGDTTAAAAAELAQHPGTSELLYAKSNSGIGGAVVANGVIARGAHGLGGELGHVPIAADGALCECGQRGCLVTVAGPDVLLDKAGLGGELAHDGLSAALAEFVALIEAGDTRANRVWAEAVPWIGRTLQAATIVADPTLVVIGGYWASPVLCRSIAEDFAARGPSFAGAPARPRIVAGAFGDDAAIVGALRAARDRALADPLALVRRA